MATGQLLNTQRTNKIPLGLKADRSQHVITFKWKCDNRRIKAKVTLGLFVSLFFC